MLPWEDIALEGFHFFGKITASISHEIKNALAIINESAGLLEDFSLLAEQGRPIDPGRLKILAVSVLKQVRRADELVKRMNRFAHSADQPVSRIDLGEIVGLTASLAQRLALLREASLEFAPPGKEQGVATRPFLLANLIWCCLEHLLTRGSKAISLTLEERGEQVVIRVSGRADGAAVPDQSFPGAPETALLLALPAELRIEDSEGERVLFIRVVEASLAAVPSPGP